MKIKMLRRSHLGRGVIAYPGQVIKAPKAQAEAMIAEGKAEEYTGKQPVEEQKSGWHLKEPCKGCPEKETEHAVSEDELGR